MSTTKLHSEVLHLVGQFDHPYRGAELAHLDLAAYLTEHCEVGVWSTTLVHPSFLQRTGGSIRQIVPFQGAYPRGGVLVLCGVHFDMGTWLELGQFRRVILICNIPSAPSVFQRIKQVERATRQRPELVFVSESQKVSLGLEGFMHPVPMRLQPMWAISRRYESKPLDSIRIGRMSRDVLQKHDLSDVQLYRSWAARGLRVIIVGGTCLSSMLGNEPNVELLPEGALMPQELLAELDIFFYRTGASTEMFGRVIWDAMASGLPVVAQAHGGYAAWLRPGQDALLVGNSEQAYDVVMTLARDATLRAQIGTNGKHLTLSMYHTKSVMQWLRFYLD